jgi:hypothetical protein
MDVKEFINKLSKINFTKAEDKELSGVIYNEIEVKLSYHTKIASSKDDVKHMPLQMVMRLEIGGVHAFSYGAADNKDNSVLVEFFIKTRSDIMIDEFAKEGEDRKQAKKVFNNL